MLTCTMRPTPARFAAAKSTLVFDTASAWLNPAWLKRTQYVL